MNYNEDNGWYYIDANNKSPSWTGVQFFYDFMTTNEGLGPYGEPASLNSLLPGDFIQLGDRMGNFYHTLVLTDVIRLPRRRVYYVAAHSMDAYRRNLLSYDFENYRGIHILGARIEDSFDE